MEEYTREKEEEVANSWLYLLAVYILIPNLSSSLTTVCIFWLINCKHLPQESKYWPLPSYHLSLPLICLIFAGVYWIFSSSVVLRFSALFGMISCLGQYKYVITTCDRMLYISFVYINIIKRKTKYTTLSKHF
jgi:hypothetical protein